jgi:hypothetical protein
MILMGEPLANYVKSLDCRWELDSEARTKTGNGQLLMKNDCRKDPSFNLTSLVFSNYSGN